MAISLLKQDDNTSYNVKEYIFNTKKELRRLPTECAPGSAAMCIETGGVYVFNSNKEWVLLSTLTSPSIQYSDGTTTTAITVSADDVTYDNYLTDIEATTVQGALDNLVTKNDNLDYKLLKHTFTTTTNYTLTYEGGSDEGIAAYQEFIINNVLDKNSSSNVFSISRLKSYTMSNGYVIYDASYGRIKDPIGNLLALPVRLNSLLMTDNNHKLQYNISLYIASKGENIIFWMAIDSVTNLALLSTDIIDNLTSTSIDKPLSANQGTILNNLLTQLQNNYSFNNNFTPTNTDIAVQEYCRWSKFGKIVIMDISISISSTGTSQVFTSGNIPVLRTRPVSDIFHDLGDTSTKARIYGVLGSQELKIHMPSTGSYWGTVIYMTD